MTSEEIAFTDDQTVPGNKQEEGEESTTAQTKKSINELMRKGSAQRLDDSIDLNHFNDDYDDNATPTQFYNPDEDDKIKLPPLSYNNSSTNLNDINEETNRDEERSASSLSNNSRVVLPKLDSRFLPK